MSYRHGEENLFIGIENELISFNAGSERAIDFTLRFPFFLKSSDYSKSGKSIRTTTGNGFYVDGDELEILTPPIAINRGFASRLTDSLMIGRERVLKTTPGLNHTGYSMHWNLTGISGVYSENMYNEVCIPFNLFGLTPLSLRAGVRAPKGGFGYELLGDSISNEEQINALALLLGSTLVALNNGHCFPITIGHMDDDQNGRFTKLYLKSHNVVINVQEYLEAFYQWFKPFIHELGTESEEKNLEQFISGEKKLEFDNFKYFSFLKDQKFKKHGVYLPFSTSDSENPGQILQLSNKEREVPLEGKLLGALVERKKRKIKYMGWSQIEFKNSLYEWAGVSEIYEKCSDLWKDLPQFKGSSRLENIKPDQLSLEKKISEWSSIDRKQYEYSSEQDKFDDPRDRPFSQIFLDSIKEVLKPRTLIKNSIFATLGFSFLLGLAYIGHQQVLVHDMASQKITSEFEQADEFFLNDGQLPDINGTGKLINELNPICEENGKEQ